MKFSRFKSKRESVSLCVYHERERKFEEKTSLKSLKLAAISHFFSPLLICRLIKCVFLLSNSLTRSLAFHIYTHTYTHTLYFPSFVNLLTLFLLVALPIKFAIINQIQKIVTLLEIHCQIGRENGFLHDIHDIAIVLGREGLNEKELRSNSTFARSLANLKDIVSFRIENHDALIEVMVLHCTGGVENAQG
jgi:hypothetical protein